MNQKKTVIERDDDDDDDDEEPWTSLLWERQISQKKKLLKHLH